MPAVVGVEWRQPHEAMHPALGFEPPVREVARHLHRHALDARLFAFRLFEDFRLVPALSFITFCAFCVSFQNSGALDSFSNSPTCFSLPGRSKTLQQHRQPGVHFIQSRA
jgi:hypothetical protein